MAAVIWSVHRRLHCVAVWQSLRPRRVVCPKLVLLGRDQLRLSRMTARAVPLERATELAVVGIDERG